MCASYVQELLEDDSGLDAKMLTAADSQEEGDYWEPADSVNELYRQLCSKKYREIERQQLE